MPRHGTRESIMLLLMGICAVRGADEKTAEAKTVNPVDKNGTVKGKPGALSPAVAADIAALAREKASRTGAQRKLDSHIVLALKKSRGEPPFDQHPGLPVDLTIQPDGRVLVDMDATVTKELQAYITGAGGEIVSSFEKLRAIRALIPMTRMEALAERADVKFISPASQPVTNSVTH